MSRLRSRRATAAKPAFANKGPRAAQAGQRPVAARGIKRPVELQLEAAYAEHFLAEWEANNGGVTVHVIELASPLLRHVFKEPLLKTALALAYAFMEKELARAVAARGIKRPVELQLEEAYAEHFLAEWEANNGGVTVHVIELASPLLRHVFKEPLLKTALALAYAFMEKELARVDRKRWGIRRRRAGRRRQAALKAAIKAQAP